MNTAASVCQQAAEGLSGWPEAAVIIAAIIAFGYVLGRLFS